MEREFSKDGLIDMEDRTFEFVPMTRNDAIVDVVKENIDVVKENVIKENISDVQITTLKMQIQQDDNIKNTAVEKKDQQSEKKKYIPPVMRSTTTRTISRPQHANNRPSDLNHTRQHQNIDNGKVRTNNNQNNGKLSWRNKN